MRKTLLLLIYLLFLTVSGKVYAQGWRDIKTVEDVCIAYPEEMKKMLGELNLNYPGMEQVKEAVASKNIPAACTLLLEYYQKSIHAQHLRKKMPTLSEKTEAEADSVLNNIFVIQNVRGVVPWGEDGHRDW